MHSDRVFGALLISTFLATGCSFNAYRLVDESNVEMMTSDKLTQMVRQRPDKVDCPDDLKAVVGSTMRCELTAGKDKLGMLLTVTNVQGDDVRWDIKVDKAIRR